MSAFIGLVRTKTFFGCSPDEFVLLHSLAFRAGPNCESDLRKEVFSYFAEAICLLPKNKSFVGKNRKATDGSFFFELKLGNPALDRALKAFFESQNKFSPCLRQALRKCQTQKEKFIVDTLVRYTHSQAQAALDHQGGVHVGSVFVVYAGTQEIVSTVDKPFYQCIISCQDDQLPPLILRKNTNINNMADLRKASPDVWGKLPETLCRKISNSAEGNELIATHGNLLVGSTAFITLANAINDGPMDRGTAFCLHGGTYHQSRLKHESCHIVCVVGKKNVDHSIESDFDDQLETEDSDDQSKDEDNDDEGDDGNEDDKETFDENALNHRTAIIGMIVEHVWGALNEEEKTALMNLLITSMNESRCNVQYTFYEKEGKESDLRGLAKLCKDIHTEAWRRYKRDQRVLQRMKLIIAGPKHSPQH